MTLSFSERVWHLTEQIPQGRVTTYKEIAHALGTRAYRAVGHALHVNPYAPRVPCHRVVSSDGGLGGFAHGLARKRELLRKEGVATTPDAVVHFDRVFYAFADKD